MIPGQTVTYTIEYENTGTGTAYGVFIIDELDTGLDETTLAINNGGLYSEPTRLLNWGIGTLAAGGKGSVSFSVAVKNGLASGTKITNMAEIYFPSGNEVTPTNPVVHIVKAISADPKNIAAISGFPAPVLLTGRASGGGSLTFRVTKIPSYGSLSGTPPDITYTSMTEYTGQDEFFYIANNGVLDSEPARVVVKVDPNPLDVTRPAVVSTSPAAGATGVPASSDPISSDPDYYLPMITVTFSEGIDAATVTSSTFTVSGLSGSVSYDDQTRTAVFLPTAPLANGTTYTGTITTGVKDKTGNALASPYTWQFTTTPAIRLTVALPLPGATAMDFGLMGIGAETEPKIVTISSSGTAALSLGTLAITGTDMGHYRIGQDPCSGKTLPPGESCGVPVIFRPLSAGSKTNAILSIPSSDPGSNPRLISLAGTGTAALTCLADATPIGGPLPVYVAFSDNSLNNPTAWLWTFGDGAAGGVRNPGHTYRTAGTFTASLSVSNASGSQNCEVPYSIFIQPCPQAPVMTGQSSRQTIHEAYAIAGEGSVINMQAMEFTGDLTLDRPVSVTLKGGFNCDYSETIPETVLNGRLIVPDRSVTIDGLVIR